MDAVDRVDGVGAVGQARQAPSAGSGQARVIRVSRELYERLGALPGVDRAEMCRRALRRFWRLGGGVVVAGECRNTTAGDGLVEDEEGRNTTTIPLRLVDLGGLDEGLDGATIRAALEALVPRGVKAGPERLAEGGWVVDREGKAVRCGD